MNQYGQMAYELNQRLRPEMVAHLDNPEAFFGIAGDEMAAAIADLRDRLLGARRPSENPEAYRLRSYQALRAAEEIVMADHHLMTVPDRDNADQSDEPSLTTYREALDQVNEALLEADRLLASDS